MYLSIEDLILPSETILHIKASLYIRESATEIIKFESDVKEMVDIIDLVGPSAPTT